MSTLTVYCFEDDDGNEESFTTMNCVEAREYASRNKLAMIAREYEYSDSELVEDFREPELEILYRCPSCGCEWQEFWSSACDSQCNECFEEDISPIQKRRAGTDDEWEDC